MKRPRIHEPGREGEPVAYEYSVPLGLGDFLPEHRERLDPWFHSVLGLGSAEIQQWLSTKWTALTDQALRNFALSLAQRIPRSVFIREERTWLVLEHPKQGDGNVVRIRAPRPLPEELESIITKMEVSALSDFFIHFRDFRESLWPDSNWIWEELRPFSSDEDDVGDIRNWKATLQFYYILSGDCMLMNKHGAV
jgi:hypothetical protein